METFEAIKKRRAIRSYSGKDIDEADLRKVIEAGMLAPSAHNFQPWQFILIRDNEMQRKLMLGNAERGILTAAAVVIAVLFDKNISEYTITDASLATENILIAAADLGIGSCVVTSFFQEAESKKIYQELKKILKIPEDLEILLFITLGFPAENAPPRELKPFDELINFDEYGGKRYWSEEKY